LTDDRIERRPLPVIRVDAIEVALYEFAATQAARAQGAMNVGDGRLFELELLDGHAFNRDFLFR